VDNPSLSDSIHSRVIGSRFQEGDQHFSGQLPMGSSVIHEKSRNLGPSPYQSQAPDIGRYRPNRADPGVDEFGGRYLEYLQEEENEPEDEWVDLTRNGHAEFESDLNGTPPSGPSIRRRPKKETQVSPAQRETFPLRSKNESVETDLPPPHLRLQPQGPFVRPLSGINHDDLGAVYSHISQWRSKLKSINAEIAEAQRESYNDIADGVNIKGWLLIGRGLRFIPGVQFIEGRAKEDIRWDVLQNERNVWDSIILWTVVAFVTVFLAAGCECDSCPCRTKALICFLVTAAIGLALSTAPNVAHTLPFLKLFTTSNTLPPGIATTLVPAVAVTLFVTLTIALINCQSVPFLSHIFLIFFSRGQ